ncbi:MAG: IMS domain-containing protein [Geminocystis sp.]|nr:IMS domain-containing protein [Geminocystis sp.]MCX8078740.1 IMS domain-containing protein [Geminocystis sp.]MDW8462462.1 IMS domain-containing protein [Geminocystis sp.]
MVEIPLDYYRILGIPLEAEPELIKQAYEDRSVQLPHQDYSIIAQSSRKNLLKVAYDTLSNPESRLQYNASLFAQEEEEKKEISLEIDNSLFLGALIILLELGEYELVLNLSQPYLNNKGKLDQLTNQVEQISLVWQDLILTVVLAHLELAREKWQEREYNLAAEYLQYSHDLLVKEDLFPHLRKEIKQDLGKLKPYRVIELLTKEDASSDPKDREKALNLLREMFNRRGGFENTSVDECGLDGEAFLRFIQQIRVYLTAEEQQKLFEAEAKRPSTAATYLFAYACIARGFAERKPELIIKAKNSLIPLTIHQDVYLEQSICALLLGQTTEAEFSLGQSKEKEAIEYIKTLSASSPDLLPGLCRYTEEWLKTEVFPQFLDLKDANPSLDAYFDDPRVQSYLESLSQPSLPETESSFPDNFTVSLPQMETENYDTTDQKPEIQQPTFPASPREEEVEEKEELIGFSDLLEAEMETSPPQPTVSSNTDKKTNPRPSHPSSAKKPVKRPHRDALLPFFIPLAAILCATSVAFLVLKVLFPKQQENLNIPLSEPLIDLPQKETDPVKENLQVQLSQEDAAAIINNWLVAKQKATGPEYDTTALDQVLTDSLAAVWKANANSLRRLNAYRRYEHKIKVLSAQTNPQNNTEAIVQAEVFERSQYYQNGALNPRLSYEEKLLVQYNLVREGQRWLIRDLKILSSR